MHESFDEQVSTASPNGQDAPLLVARTPVWVRLLVTLGPVAGLVVAVGFSMHGRGAVSWILIGLSLVVGMFAPMLLMHRVLVFTDRLEQRGLFGQRRLRFDEIERVRLGSGRSAGTTPTTGASFYGAGTTIALGFVKDSADVYDFINPLVVPLLATRLNQQIDECGSVQFGQLAAAPDGVHTRKGLLPWHLIGAFSFGPAGARIIPINHPELTVTVPNATNNLPALVWIVESRKEIFFNALKAMASTRGISEEELLAAYERRLPAGQTFGMPEYDEEFGRHLCTLPPATIFGVSLGRSKYALYEGGIVGGSKRIAVRDCASIAYKVVNQYLKGTYLGTLRTLTLKSKSGVKLSISSIREEGEAFCDAAIGRVLPHLVSEHRERLRNGEVIAYGKAKLSLHTIELGRKVVLLASLVGVNDHEGSLYFWTDLRAKPIGFIDLTSPNAMVLQRMLHEIIYSAA